MVKLVVHVKATRLRRISLIVTKIMELVIEYMSEKELEIMRQKVAAARMKTIYR
jgi:hypothetical protein